MWIDLNISLAFSDTLKTKKTIPYDRNYSSVQFSRSVVSDSLRSHEPQHAGTPCPSPTLGVHTNPCPLCP